MTKRKWLVFSSIGLVSFLLGWYLGVRLGNPFTKTHEQWSIGIYGGDSPFALRPLAGLRNPVLTIRDVPNVPAGFLADPFLIRRNSVWYLYFEVWNPQIEKGSIGLATSTDGRKWEYQQLVLDEPFHLSYPYVFESKNEIYLLPESAEANGLRLYRAADFPRKWELTKVLMQGVYLDPSVFFFNGRWWLFACSTFRNDSLRLYSAADLLGPWTEHPKSPLVAHDAGKSRPGGRVLAVDGQIYRFAQDDRQHYGSAVRAFRITTLTPTDYAEVEVLPTPLLSASGSGWNAVGMHTLDAHQLEDGQWLAAVDGLATVRSFTLRRQPLPPTRGPRTTSR